VHGNAEQDVNAALSALSLFLVGPTRLQAPLHLRTSWHYCTVLLLLLLFSAISELPVGAWCESLNGLFRTCFCIYASLLSERGRWNREKPRTDIARETIKIVGTDFARLDNARPRHVRVDIAIWQPWTRHQIRHRCSVFMLNGIL